MPSFPTKYSDISKFIKGGNKSFLSSPQGADDPTYLGFVLLFDTTSPLFKDAEGSLDDLTGGVRVGSGNSDSAYSYLLNIGEDARARYLRQFVNGILQINREYPYYWQTIEGLDILWEKDTMFTQDYNIYRGGDDSIININTLESIDMKITALVSLYKSACFDMKMRRAVVPQNLRYFDVDIYIQEIRKFKTVARKITDLFRNTRNDINRINGIRQNIVANDDENQSLINRIENGIQSQFKNTSELVNKNTATVIFSLTDCEFVPGNSATVFGNVSNTGPDVASQSLAWKYSDALEVSQFPQIGERIDDRGLTGQGQRLIEKFETNLVNFVEDETLGRLRGITLGNVHGTANTIRTVANSITNANLLGSGLLDSVVGGDGSNLSPISVNQDVPGPKPFYTKRIQPEGRQPTNNDGSNPSNLSSFNINQSAPGPDRNLNSRNVHE